MALKLLLFDQSRLILI